MRVELELKIRTPILSIESMRKRCVLFEEKFRKWSSEGRKQISGTFQQEEVNVNLGSSTTKVTLTEFSLSNSPEKQQFWPWENPRKKSQHRKRGQENYLKTFMLKRTVLRGINPILFNRNEALDGTFPTKISYFEGLRSFLKLLSSGRFFGPLKSFHTTSRDSGEIKMTLSVEKRTWRTYTCWPTFCRCFSMLFSLV